MANNEIFTRIQLKYDSYTAWTTAPGKDVVLLSGELGIAKLVNDVTVPLDSEKNAPVLFKVGDGAHTFEQLPWVSGLAADVYAWAKKATPDWTDFPALPLTVVDEGTGKFVTDFTYADNKLTITRSDVNWADIQNKPDLVNSVKVTDDDVVIGTPVDAASGDVTIDIKHKAYNKAGATTDVAGDATTAGSSVTIKVPTLTVDAYGHTEFTGETSHTITIPNEVAVGDGNITIAAGDGLTEGGSFNANQDNDATITLKHADTSDAADLVAEGRKYVTGLTFDDYGHVTGYTTGAETDQDKVELAEKVEHKFTVNGVEFDGSADQTVTIDASSLGLESAMHFVGAHTEAPATAKAGDVYLNTATKKEYVYSDGQGWVELGDEGSYALKVTGATAGNFAGLDSNGNLTDSGKKASDFKTVQEAKNYDGSTTKTVTNVKQNANGEVEVTYTDIAFPEASGSATIASVADDVVTLKAGAVLGEDHVLANDANADITLAKVAKTGNIADLVQTENTYIVFNCGTSTTVI